MPAIKSTIILLFFIAFSFTGNSQLVYKTPSGAKYHLATCHMVKNASEKLTVAAAAKIGLTPCRICNPPASIGAPSTKPAQGQSATVQCKGQTKAGNRCLHKTSIGNGYCFQHQPG